MGQKNSNRRQLTHSPQIRKQSLASINLLECFSVKSSAAIEANTADRMKAEAIYNLILSQSYEELRETYAVVIAHDELVRATNSFSEENLIGQGGFGSVFKGKLPTTEQVVAVKKHNDFGEQGNKEFRTEIVMLTSAHHPNIVKLIGYCRFHTADDQQNNIQRCIVYEFMPNGSLDSHLHFDDLEHNKQPLDWERRMRIALGVANGLCFLHHFHKPPVIYRDLKPSNILLDAGFNPKISDFGLAEFKIGGRNIELDKVIGTVGYCSPDYVTTGPSFQTDVYSYGVVLLELLSGRKAVDRNRGGGLELITNWVRSFKHEKKDVADPRLNGVFPEKVLIKLVGLALKCVHEKPNKRPTMIQVLNAIRGLVGDLGVTSNAGENATAGDQGETSNAGENETAGDEGETSNAGENATAGDQGETSNAGENATAGDQGETSNAGENATVQAEEVTGDCG